jgi:molecular chaperone GrpE
MSKGVFQDIVTFFSEPMPVLGRRELDMLRNLEAKFDHLAKQLEAQNIILQQLSDQPQVNNVEQVPADDLVEQVRKLAKTQFKANTLQEKQQIQQQEMLEGLQGSVDEYREQLAKQSRQATEATQLEILKSLLPVMDSLDAAFNIGRRQVLGLPMSPEVKRPVIAWLDGIRLARIRLLDVLATHGVTPLQVVGKPFDPRHHVAVAVDNSKRMPDGTIVSEDRRGYASATKILREAEVVVAKSI